MKSIHITDKENLKWYHKIPLLYYTSMFGYRCFFHHRILQKHLSLKLKLIDKKRHFDWWLDKKIHNQKCVCGHPFWFHVCYEHGTCNHGVCLSSTFNWEADDCGCENYHEA